MGMLRFKEGGGQHRVHWHQHRLCHSPVCPAVVGFALSAVCLGASVIVGRGQAPHREVVGSLGALGLGLTQKNEPLCKAGWGGGSHFKWGISVLSMHVNF